VGHFGWVRSDIVKRAIM